MLACAARNFQNIASFRQNFTEHMGNGITVALRRWRSPLGFTFAVKHKNLGDVGQSQRRTLAL